MPAGKKTRTGCARCKEKRELKCDETLPSCARCLRARVNCPGYQQALRWSAKHQLIQYNPRHEQNNTAQDAGAMVATRNQDVVQTGEQLPAQEDTTQMGLLTTSYNPSPIADLASWSEMPVLYGTVAPNDIVDLEIQRSWILDYGDLENEIQPGRTSTSPMAQRSESCQRQNTGHFQADVTSSSYSLEEQGATDLIWPVIVQPEYALVEYYFREVATICSCYDGDMNPFRSIVGRLWTSSGNMAKTLQSMAAACLAPSYPHLAKEGFKLRQEVSTSISTNLTFQDSICVTLMTTIMLGQTSGWHDPRDLGLTYYRHAKTLLRRLESDATALERSVVGKDITFFQNAIGYWETILAFVVPKDELGPCTKLSVEAEPSLLLIQPHPWAFVAPELMEIVRQVGHLVWANRVMRHESKFWCKSDLLDQLNAISESSRLERCLLEFELPTENGLVDPGDTWTPVSHLLTISQAYRLVALMMLYRVFPDTLIARMQSEESFQDLEHYLPTHLVQSLDPLSERDRNVWLGQLALRALKLVRSVPLTSRTRCVQPFLLLALSGEVGSMELCSHDDSGTVTSEARTFIQSRLEDFLHYLPPNPARRRLDLVFEVGRKIDRGERNVFWIDVVIEKGWRFLFG